MTAAVDRLVAAYRDIEQRQMQGLPICNRALRVEAVDFEPRGSHLCGVLITPWFMNLLLLPAETGEWSAADSGRKVHCRFPAGEYEFTVSAPGVVDAHLSTPLFSTVRDFPDQDTARRVAREVLERLFQVGAAADSADPVAAQLERSGFGRPVSRRALLRDWLSAGQGPDHA